MYGQLVTRLENVAKFCMSYGTFQYGIALQGFSPFWQATSLCFKFWILLWWRLEIEVEVTAMESIPNASWKILRNATRLAWHACVYAKCIYAGLHTNFFSWWPDRATKIINYQFLVARTGNLVAPQKKSEMNGGNIRLRMTLKINVECRKWINGGNIRLLMTLK